MEKCSTIAETEEQQPEPTEEPQPQTRPRAVTFSSPAASSSSAAAARPAGPTTAGAVSPQFMFLQLYQATGLSSGAVEKPIMVPSSKSVESSLKILDRIFCYETHKVGVLYVGPGQANDEQAILG